MTATAQLPLHLDADVVGPPLKPDRSNLRDWLAVRRSGVTGTDLPAIVGMSKWKSAMGVYMEKLGEIDDVEVGEAGEWGQRLEPVIADYFAEQHRELSVLDSPGVLASKTRPHLLVNVDRLAVGRGEVRPAVVEIKTTNQFLAREWDPDRDEVPPAALLQAHTEMAVTGAPVAYLVALIGGQHYVELTIERDEEMVARIGEIADEFWERVQRRDPPMADGSKATTQLLGRLYDVDPDGVRVLDPAEVLPLLEQFEVTKAAEKAAETAHAEVCNRLKVLLGEKEIGVLDGEPVVTWKQTKRAGYTVAPTVFRQLRVPKRSR